MRVRARRFSKGGVAGRAGKAERKSGRKVKKETLKREL